MTNETLAYLAERVREIVGHRPGITEKTMFGGRAFLLNGHFLVACEKDGQILLSVGRDHHEAALARPGATVMVQGGRTMTGFIWVDPDAIEDGEDLRNWVAFAWDAVSAKPPKVAKAKTAKARSRTPK